MNQTIEKRDRLIAAVATIGIAIVIMLFLLFSSLGENIEQLIAQNEYPQEEEIFLDAELLELGETVRQQSNRASAPKIEGEPRHSDTPNEELIEPGTNENPTIEPQQVTQHNESNLQTLPPTATEREESQITSTIRDRFSRPNGNQNADSNVNGSGGSGIGTTGNLRGRTFLGCPTPTISISKEVTIIVRITVDENGKVTNASFLSDKGPGAGNRQLRNACVKASYNAKWSAKKGTATQTGTLTWNLKPKS